MMKFKTPLIYGFVVALAGSVLMLTLIWLKLIGPEAISLDKEMVGGTVLFLMLYLFLLFGIYFVIRKRKELNGQTISYKEALLQGLVLSLSTAIFSILFTYLFYEFLYPEYVTATLDALKMKMEEANIPLEKIEEKLLEKQVITPEVDPKTGLPVDKVSRNNSILDKALSKPDNVSRAVSHMKEIDPTGDHGDKNMNILAPQTVER